MNAESSRRLVVPALQARMGDWIYYVAFLRMRDVAERISMAEEIHQTKSLNDWIQRRLRNRAPEIKDYLLSHQQRFFNALVVGVYGGAPQWYELDIRGNELLDVEDLPDYIEGVHGLLVLEGDTKLFAIDGQHRVAGIRAAIEASEEIGEEDISTIFVAHSNDTQGLIRTRRLFSTLNRNAKAVSQGDIVALDEDDVVAIVTRQVYGELPLLRDKVLLAQSKNMPVSDVQNLTTIVTLYEVLDILLPSTRRGWKDFKKVRPKDEIIEQYYDRAVDILQALTTHFEPLQELQNSAPSDQVASKYRSRAGGHLLFRPVGFLMVARVVRRLQDSNMALREAVGRVSAAPMFLTQDPWLGLLWDGELMLTAPENKKVAEHLLFNAVGGDLSEYKISASKLKKDYARLLKRSEVGLSLPKYV